jgi:pimeloyl-ACP methyl ester carboxylesterase
MSEKETDVTMSTSFGALKQVDAGLLSVGYAESGPADGPAVFLLHGWPYDIHSFAEAAPLLAAAGYRVIVPFVRGYGTTRFLSDGTLRNGQPAAVAADVIAHMDALGIEHAILAGFDWGARSANVVAALWPDRCKAQLSVSGYLIGSQAANAAPLPLFRHGWAPTRLGFAGLVACRPPRSCRGRHLALCLGGDVYPLTFTSRLTTGQFTTNPLGPNGVPAGNPVALPSATCCKAAEKSVWRRLSPAVTAASVQVARWTSHMGL